MRLNALASCAVLLSTVASAQVVEKPTNSGTSASGANGISGTTLAPAPLGGAALTNTQGLGLQGTIGGVTPTPNAVVPVNAVQPGAIPGAAVPLQISPVPGKSAAVIPGAKAAPGAPAAAVGIPSAADPAAAAQIVGADGTKAPSASSTLDSAARGIVKGRGAEGAGSGDGLSIGRALDRTYDAKPGAGDVSDAGGVKASVGNGKAANFTALADKETMANAPRLYADAIKAVRDALPATASAAERRSAETDVKAILRHARAKSSDKDAVSSFLQAVVDEAASGSKGSSARNAAAVQQWTKLYAEMGGRPFIVNDAPLRTLTDKLAGENGRGKSPRVWAESRSGGWLAAGIPGAPVAKIPGLAASFKMKLEALAPSPVADAYRAFAARPGLRTAVSARVALGDSVPSAVIGTFWSWIKTLAVRAWHGLLSMLPGRGLPAVADASTTPRLKAAAAAWREATVSGEAAARAAGAPRPTVARARAAFVLARKAAAAHESLTGEAGASARVEAMSATFEDSVKLARLAPSDRLTPALEEWLAGDGGLRHWSSRWAADARERGAASFSRVKGASKVVTLSDGPAALAAPLLAAASKGGSVVAYGDALWASGTGEHGAVVLSADLRPTEAGGSVSVKVERGDDALARGLDQLGFRVIREGRGLSGKLDSETAVVDARDVASLAADAASLASGGAVLSAPSPEGLERLLADVKTSPAKAEKTAAALDGRSTLSRARTIAWVGDLEAVSAEIPSRGERVLALRDASGLAKYARVEPLRTR